MKAVAIALDGVLRKVLDEQAHDLGGSLLYHALAEQFRIVVLGSADSDKDDQFLTVNGFIRHVKVEPMRAEDSPSIVGQRRRQLRRLRAEGYNFEFVVVPDPEMAKHIYADGVTALLFLHPEFSSPTFRPDYHGGIRAWSELESEVDYQRTTKANQIRQEHESVTG